MSDVLVKVDNVSKRFCRSLKRSLWYGLQDLGSEIGGRRHGGGSGLPQSSTDVQLRPDEFWAVKDVSFELRRGECLGLIGRNGAGKTTLLRMLNGLIKPDTGKIEMKGSVGALIALGAGFNPILTGRENIYVNAGVLGISKNQVDIKIEEIVNFAELGEFIDSPVQTYSSGMQVRLGFAVATAIRPDILILDEVLAVGDSGFKFKCYEAIDNLLATSAIIFVSHSMSDVRRICTNAIILSQAATNGAESVDDAILSYNNFLKSNSAGAGFVKVNLPVTDFNVIVDAQVDWLQPLEIILEVESLEDVESPDFIVNFILKSGEYAANAYESGSRYGIKINKGSNTISLSIPSVPLKRGCYDLAFHILSDRRFIASHSKLATIAVMGTNPGAVSPCLLPITLSEQVSKVVYKHN
jgi:lipopolysaccharide transport system ATP-binding protein